VYEIRAPEIGKFFHDSMEALLQDIHAQKRQLGAMEQVELENRINRIADEQFQRKDYEIFQTTAWYRLLADNLRRILRSSASAMAFQEKQGDFLPQFYELAFGFDEQGGAPPISINLGGGRRILLRGRVDRIDRAVHPLTGEEFLRIVDYKAGATSLALHELYYGLKLQLILYMRAALASLPQSKPAGMFYFRVHDPLMAAENVLEAQDAGWLEEMAVKSHALKGYLLADKEVTALMDRDYAASRFLPVRTLKSGDFSKASKVLTQADFQLLGDYSQRVLRQAGESLMAGDISLKPYRTGARTACDYCLYRSVCRFDQAIPGHSFRYLPEMSDETALTKMAGFISDGNKVGGSRALGSGTEADAAAGEGETGTET
jgi:ATP-dependent helicase/nuclease subunit B